MWPETGALPDQGFTDTCPAEHPDPVAEPAFTWTPEYPEDTTHDHPTASASSLPAHPD
ncbi:MAG: hypothetical protein NTX73_10375 [Rhodobacterales bacterium]|jgi:hypothetical protein|nr:hypothetical protein [Rhodobacterales bacterium]